METKFPIMHECADFSLNASRADLYKLGLYPLRCRACGLQKPNIEIKQQKELSK